MAFSSYWYSQNPQTKFTKLTVVAGNRRAKQMSCYSSLIKPEILSSCLNRRELGINPLASTVVIRVQQKASCARPG